MCCGLIHHQGKTLVTTHIIKKFWNSCKSYFASTSIFNPAAICFIGGQQCNENSAVVLSGNASLVTEGESFQLTCTCDQLCRGVRFFVSQQYCGGVLAQTCETNINTEHYYVQCLNSTTFTLTVRNVSVKKTGDIWQCQAVPEENDPWIYSNCVTFQVKGTDFLYL